MKIHLFIILFIYFLFGGVLILYITGKYNESDRKRILLKFFTYFGIVNLLLLSILIKPVYFYYLSIIIISAGYIEIIRLTFLSDKIKVGVVSLLFITIFFYGFLKFSQLPPVILLNVVGIVVIFDGFSQVTGQIMGKRKLFPTISPNKTVEGLIGGYFFSVLTAVLTHNLFETSLIFSIFFGLAIASSAFCGDFMASCIKRKFGVKDFSGILPGHGGFLDRFDSLIISGSLAYSYYIFLR